ncbi:MAG TPA: heparan-alpha-glucosaminide N-acetyltransferase domain-containing protein [Rheinheimera sp.]|nr:heparan-alpha-glucosaminide N-acetyltransferase domain-containing protein [Rheinheimera sp.]
MAKQRFIALDALRGLAIALMILVNTPGSWQHVYAPLLHAPWDGFTFADIVFPGFLFVVGAAMFYSLRTASLTPAVLWRIAKRSLLLIAIGILLNWYPFTTAVSELRIPGVLQRIGLSYAIAAILVLSLRGRYLLPLSVLLLTGYYLLLQMFGDGQPFSLQHNAVLKLDLLLLGPAHLYQGFGIAFDPEGLLSTMPAVVSVLAGFMVAQQLSDRSAAEGLRWLLQVVVVLLAISLVLASFWPLNKALWSGSYVTLSTAILVLLLALLLWLSDINGKQQWVQPWVTYGTNPLFIYILSWLWAATLMRIPVADTNLYQASFELLALVLPAKMASLLFAILHVVLFWWLSRLLYRRGIVIRL